MTTKSKKLIIGALTAVSIAGAGIGIHTEYENLVTHLVSLGEIPDNGFDYNYLPELIRVTKGCFLEGYQNGNIEGITKYNTVFMWIGNAVYTIQNIF